MPLDHPGAWFLQPPFGGRERRFHKKRDGWLMVEPDGQSRFLTRWESILYSIFGKEPARALGKQRGETG